jgi:hypothetical protein
MPTVDIKNVALLGIIAVLATNVAQKLLLIAIAPCLNRCSNQFKPFLEMIGFNQNYYISLAKTRGQATYVELNFNIWKKMNSKYLV